MIRRSALGMMLLFVSLLWHGNLCADERILSYHSDISIAADATMTVDETIRVRAEGINIRRGIYRDFPTDYNDEFGNHAEARMVEYMAMQEPSPSAATRFIRPKEWPVFQVYPHDELMHGGHIQRVYIFIVVVFVNDIAIQIF